MKKSPPSVVSKDELRAFLLPKRAAISPHDIESKSLQIQKHIEHYIKTQRFKAIAGFGSYQSEPNLWPLLQSILDSGFKLLLPKIVDYKNCLMEFFPVTNLQALKKNKYGISEPESTRPYTFDDSTLMLTPTLAVDRLGNRLGYGQGYYDRFLNTRPNVKPLAVVFSEFVFDSIPHDHHDQKVHGFVTEAGITTLR